MQATPVQSPPAPADGLRRKRFTREEVERLIDEGFFDGQRFELIDGDLIDKMGQGARHAAAIRLLLEWLGSFIRLRLILVQLPIETAGPDRDWSVPEPDLAVVREWSDEHLVRFPRGDELALAVEVSDTSAAVDLKRKAELYARAGVPEYWVLDLPRRILTVHRQTDGTQYKQIQLYSEEEQVCMEGRAEHIKVGDLLPQPGNA